MSSVDARTERTRFETAGAQRATFTMPVHADPGPLPVAISFHGDGGDVDTRLDDPATLGLRDVGFAVMTGDFHGRNWGNDAALTDLLAMLAWVRDQGYEVGPILLYGGSMGGLTALCALQSGVLAQFDVRGWYGTQAVCSLGAAFARPEFAEAISAAYGFVDPSDFVWATSGHDPSLPGAVLPRIRYRFLASPGDTLVPKADHTDPLRRLLPTDVGENSLLVTSGEHYDPSHFDREDLVDFARRCLADRSW